MKINVLTKEARELKIEIVGASYGLCNLLQKTLLEDKNVDLAGYDVPHPLASNPVIYVRTKGDEKPEEALIRATEKAIKTNSAFGKELKKALKS